MKKLSQYAARNVGNSAQEFNNSENVISICLANLGWFSKEYESILENYFFIYNTLTTNLQGSFFYYLFYKIYSVLFLM